MDDYGQVLWLPVCAGLTVLGVLLSILVWRRRGAASGLRIVSWSLLPIGLYLVGLLPVIVPFGIRVVRWATSSVFSLTAWIGAAVIGLAVLLWIISGVLLGRRRAAAEVEGDEGGDEVESGSPASRKQVEPSKGKAAGDDEFGDIEDLLKRRGIE